MRDWQGMLSVLSLSSVIESNPVLSPSYTQPFDKDKWVEVNRTHLVSKTL